MLSVLRAALAAGEAERAWSLVAAVHPLLTAVDDHPYRLRLWQAGEAAARALRDDRRRVRALRWISHSYGIAGQVRQELPPAREALALAERLDDPGETAQTLRRLGEALRGQNQFDAAEAALTRALRMFVELGEVAEEIEVRAALGVLYNNFWRHEDSIPVLERARELLPAQETIIHGWVMLGLGLAYKFAGRRAESAELTDRAFGIARRLGNDFMLGYCFQERAWLVDQGGRYAEAERDFQEMLAIFERIRHGSGVGAAHEGLGVLAEKQGRHEDALAHFDAAIDRYDRLGDRVRAGELRLRRSATRHALGREAEAVHDREEAERLIGDTPIRREPGLLARLPVRPSTQPQAQ